MVCKMNVYSWKDIMRTCAPCTASEKDARELLKYIDFFFKDGIVTACGSNAFQISRVEITNAVIKDAPLMGFHLFIPPMKTPPHTKSVEIHVDEDAGKYTVIFLDDDTEEADVLEAVEKECVRGEPMDFGSFFKKAQDNFDKTSRDGSGQYHIVVNTKFLLNALEGMKSQPTVIFNFGDPNNPFTIRPFGGDMDATALVYPVRIL